MSNTGMGRRNIGAMQNRDNIPKDDAKKALAFSMKIAPLNTGRVTDPEDLAERFEKLFEIAYEEGFLPRIEHLCLVSGLPTRTFFDYGNADNPSGPSQLFSPTIQKAKMIIAAAEANLASTGKMPAPVYIFRAKNFNGLKDVQEIKAVAPTDIRPQNETEILNEMPELPESNSTLIDLGTMGDFDKE